MEDCPHGKKPVLKQVHIPKAFNPIEGEKYYAVSCGKDCVENRYFTDAFIGKKAAVHQWNNSLKKKVNNG